MGAEPVRTFAVVNQKGGCGKTTTAINLAGVFASRGYRTLLVDMDPQGHCAVGLAIPEQRVDLHIGDAMLAEDAPIDPQRLLWRVMRNLDLAPSTLRLAALEASRGDLAGKADAEQRLKKVLSRFESRYDVCLIDCSPAIGMLAFNALVAADEILIPVETGFFSLQGATKQINSIKSLGKRLGVAPPHHLLATLHDPNSALSQDLLEELRRRFGARVLPVVIRFDQALRESASFGQPVIEYSPQSMGAQDYTALAEHLIRNSLQGGEASPRESFDPGSDMTGFDKPEVHVVPGVGERAIAAVSAIAQREEPQATSFSSAGVSPVMQPGVSDTGGTPVPLPLPLPASDAGITRAMDLVARARKLQNGNGHASTEVRATLAERKAEASVAGLSAVAEIQEKIKPTPHPLPLGGGLRAFGAQVTPEGVLFCQPLTIGREVGVAGEFNNWSYKSSLMRANPKTGMLEVVIRMPAGSGAVQYRLVVDGKWMPDPFNPHTAANPFGDLNSVIDVGVGTNGVGIGKEWP